MTEQPKLWSKFWPADVPETLQYPDVTLPEILRKTAREHGEKTAIVFREREINYRELDVLSDKFAAALSSIGIVKCDRVAVFLPNIPQFIIAYFGVMKAGAVVTAISPLHKERELEHQLNDSEAKIIVVLKSLHPIVKNVWSKTQLKNAIVTNLETFTSETEQNSNVYSFQKLLTEDANPQNVKINPAEDLAALQYTGGTTGTAKGAMLTHANLVANTLAFAAWIKGA
ncbi:long-chain fatty acid--CoA ligase, partial [Candidatus Bathyarchaeota archaeon]